MLSAFAPMIAPLSSTSSSVPFTPQSSCTPSALSFASIGFTSAAPVMPTPSAVMEKRARGSGAVPAGTVISHCTPRLSSQEMVSSALSA